MTSALPTTPCPRSDDHVRVTPARRSASESESDPRVRSMALPAAQAPTRVAPSRRQRSGFGNEARGVGDFEIGNGTRSGRRASRCNAKLVDDRDLRDRCRDRAHPNGAPQAEAGRRSRSSRRISRSRTPPAGPGAVRPARGAFSMRRRTPRRARRGPTGTACGSMRRRTPPAGTGESKPDAVNDARDEPRHRRRFHRRRGLR